MNEDTGANASEGSANMDWPVLMSSWPTEFD